MSITKIEDGEFTYYKVRVFLKSKIKPTIRVELQKSGLKTEQEAKRAEKNLFLEAQRTMIQKEQVGIRWERLVDDWETALREGEGAPRIVGKATIQDYGRALRLHTEHWMQLPVDEISRHDVKTVLDNLTVEGLSNSRKRAVVNAINGAFRWAKESGLVPSHLVLPTAGVKISRVEEKKPEVLTLNEIRTLLMAAKQQNHPWYYIWAMALQTGMRSGELLALEWVDVEWETRRLTVSKTYNRRFKEIKKTKGGYWRDVPINSELERILKELRAASSGSKFVLPRFLDWERGESARVLRTFCAGIGITSVRFHALRACFATQLLRDKVAPAVVMKVCGWKDLKTMQCYIRLAGIETDGATDGLRILPAEEAMNRVVALFQH